MEEIEVKNGGLKVTHKNSNFNSEKTKACSNGNDATSPKIEVLSSNFKTTSSKLSQKSKIKSLYIKKIIGYILLFLVIIINVLSSIWVKDITENVKPFLFTYIDYSFLSILILVHYVKKKMQQYFKRKKLNDEEKYFSEMEEGILSDDHFSETFEKIQNDNVNEYKQGFHFMVIVLMIFWYFGNVFYNLGLTRTSITSSNTLSNVTIIFLFTLKVLIFKKYSILKSWFKIVSTFLCVGGIILMAIFENYNIQQSEGQEHSIVGDIYLILGALFYSFYSIYLKYSYKKHRHQFDMMEVFGYLGLYNLLLIPFLLLLLNVLSIEIIKFPEPMTILYIFLNAVVAGIISDLCQSYCITLLAVHIVSFGLTLSIPLSFFYDMLLKTMDFNLFYLFGTILIFSSFILIFIENIIKIRKKKEKMTVFSKANSNNEF
jgi:drug/metabolite transporter (DMT)-like permease